MKKLLVCTALLLSMPVFNSIALDDGLLIEKIVALDWKTEAREYHLSGTSTSVTISQEEMLVVGEDAHKYFEITQGLPQQHNTSKSDAVVVRYSDNNSYSEVFYKFIETGFLKMDDWDEFIDKDALLETMKEINEDANKIRAEGYPKIYVSGWAQDPYLDRENAVAYWAVSLRTDTGKSGINAVGLKLGRRGVSAVRWVGDPELFTNAEYVLRRSLNAYQFDHGAKYADFVPGTDAVAAVGVGALAYKMITGKKIAKTVGLGLLALLAVFAKKLWFLIFVPFVFLFGWIKRKMSK